MSATTPRKAAQWHFVERGRASGQTLPLKTTEPPTDRRYADYTEHGPRGEGRLIYRIHQGDDENPAGRREFFLRARAGGTDTLESLGRHSMRSGDGGITLEEARAKKAELVRSMRDSSKTLAELKIERAQQIRDERRVAAIQARRGSFQDLQDAYVKHLADAGKQSAADVRTIFARAMKNKPELASLKAGEIQQADIQAMLAARINQGVTREVNKLRAYLHAAFDWGGKSDYDPRRMAAKEVRFDLTANPVALVPAVAEFNRSAKNPMQVGYLHRYWQAIGDEPNEIHRAFLRFLAYLGGQRVAQMLRLEWSQVTFKDAQNGGQATILLMDGKGRRAEAQPHLLPVPAQALEYLQAAHAITGAGRYVWSNDGGITPIDKNSVSKAGNNILRSLFAEDQAETGDGEQAKKHHLKDLRSTIETLLSSHGVSTADLAVTLSHGYGTGIQGKHYNAYDFIKEKRRTLDKLARLLGEIFDGKKPGKVIQGRFA